jgi:hypothetical protein
VTGNARAGGARHVAMKQRYGSRGAHRNKITNFYATKLTWWWRGSDAQPTVRPCASSPSTTTSLDAFVQTTGLALMLDAGLRAVVLLELSPASEFTGRTPCLHFTKDRTHAIRQIRKPARTPTGETASTESDSIPVVTARPGLAAIRKGVGSSELRGPSQSIQNRAFAGALPMMGDTSPIRRSGSPRSSWAW